MLERGNEIDECIVRTKGTQDFISQRLRERRYHNRDDDCIMLFLYGI